jgi:hypothetical protein
MRRSTWLVAVGAALAIVAGQTAVAEAQHENSQQEKMTTCNADAKTKDLKGDERKAFMKTCLSAKGGAGAAMEKSEKAEKAGKAEKSAKSEKVNAQQEKMKTCSTDAKTKGLKGDERKSFMKDCLKGAKAH